MLTVDITYLFVIVMCTLFQALVWLIGLCYKIYAINSCLFVKQVYTYN